MQKTRARRCQVPIRARRRQSDAKWRASVASCYETLRFVIPNGKTLPKRKASKSLILQETEKHIGDLEKALSSLLNIEAQKQGQGVLWRKGEHWLPATLEDFQYDFAKQQRNIFHRTSDWGVALGPQPQFGTLPPPVLDPPLTSQGRRCYNMLHDIQEEITNMKVDCGRLAFLPLSSAATTATLTTETREATTCTRRNKVSRARWRYETERACQRILASYRPGDQVNAVIPSPISTTPSATVTSNDYLQAVPATPTATTIDNNNASSLHAGLYNGTTVRLQRMGNAFVTVGGPYVGGGGERSRCRVCRLWTGCR